MLPGRPLNPGPLALELNALPTALRGPAFIELSVTTWAGPRSAIGRAPDS